MIPAGNRAIAFEQTGLKLNMSSAVIEKDFWVCWALARLFSSDVLRNKILFKGGTSLSKVFNVIHRFSEDIDLVLDWNEVTAEDPLTDRSKTQQDRFNKSIVEWSREYLRDRFLPEVRRLVAGVCEASIEEDAQDVINIRYPAEFVDRYLRPEIRLEIGPLAQWVPNAEYEIHSYVADVFPHLDESSMCRVRTIKAERTFWEKVTILHQEAFRPDEKPLPARFSRHYYDLAMMAGSTIKDVALADLELLRSVVAFKTKFYPRAWARYELVTPGTMRLMPLEDRMKALRDDYARMQVMFFGEFPKFDDMISALRELEGEINGPH